MNYVDTITRATLPGHGGVAPPRKRFFVVGTSTRTGRHVLAGDFHSLEVAQDVAAHCNLLGPNGRLRPTAWRVADTAACAELA